MQNQAHHTRYVAGYHIVLTAILGIGSITAFINVWLQYAAHYDMLNSILIAVLFIASFFTFYYMRQFPLRAQDRVIRLEENFRYYVLTHKTLDSRISLAQVIALRFAADEELVVLVERTIKENLSPAEIKKEIKNWRADNSRM
jgi:formate hydrogenlyase subunit 3/multisubunit Na+/H+ antiporter MnhD subunit